MALRLGASILVASDGTYDCRRCPEAVQRERGCSRFAPHPRPPFAPFSLKTPDGGQHDFWDCPVNVLSDEHHGLLRQYVHHRAGHPWHGPAAGAWPWRYLRAMEVVGDEVSQLEEAERERDRRFANTRAGGPMYGRRAA